MVKLPSDLVRQQVQRQWHLGKELARSRGTTKWLGRDPIRYRLYRAALRRWMITTGTPRRNQASRVVEFVPESEQLDTLHLEESVLPSDGGMGALIGRFDGRCQRVEA